ncbi:response regulator transcription factor [Paenibacillus sp. JCM 10914]|uniref:response regulator n=1 Tax=Paenibacillus sp. JCM 10914 TaxID=1236974 RepID=UPI0003CC4B87|nr:response regulator transcription factor [Paenibacillus sp. JCM 10914]GAE05046.1 DNA-binding response regulator, LuxR family [Paenibacillus sp. JCM 10914]
MIRLLIADDHAMVRKGLQVFLSTQTDLMIVGEAVNGEEVLTVAQSVKPDIILMDLQMPILNGIETTSRLTLEQPHVKVIVLTSFVDYDHVLPAIRAGAKGYLQKDIEPEDLVTAIRRVSNGQVELHPEAAGLLMTHVTSPGNVEGAGVGIQPDPKPQELASLTPRETEVLQLIASGMNNREISEALFITEKTVKTHVSHLLDKLGLADRTQAAIFALKNGIA